VQQPAAYEKRLADRFALGHYVAMLAAFHLSRFFVPRLKTGSWFFFFALFPLFLNALFLTGCSPVGTAIGVAATAANMATEERGFSRGIDDRAIWFGITNRLYAADKEHDGARFKGVGVQVHEARVLLSGSVDTPADRVEALRIAWEAQGVREVMSEVKVAADGNLDNWAQDQWIAQDLHLRLMLDIEVRANNYSIECANSTIYLMGIAHDKKELQRVIDHARDIAYVKAVVSHVRLKSDPLPPSPTNQGPPGIATISDQTADPIIRAPETARHGR